VPSDQPTTSHIQVSGLSHLITPTRTLDPHTGRRVYTHGLGIELDLKPGETRQILHGGAEGGLANKGQGGGAGAIGRWNTSSEGRQELFRERLERWVELNGGYEVGLRITWRYWAERCHRDVDVLCYQEPNTVLPTPSTSGASTRSSIPPIPILPLPHLPSSTLLPSANLFSSPGTTSGPGLTSSPKKPVASSAGLSDPFVLEEKRDSKGKVIRPGSVEERKQAMMDRVRGIVSIPLVLTPVTDQSPLWIGEGIASDPRFLSWRVQQGEYVRCSAAGGAEEAEYAESAGEYCGGCMDVSAMLSCSLCACSRYSSRLMRSCPVSRSSSIRMFSAPSPGPNTLPTPPRGRRKAIPITEVADVIVKSSKTPISSGQ